MKKLTIKQKELRTIFENQFKQEMDTKYCPTCKRGYLMEEEKEMIQEAGQCYACDWFAKHQLAF